MVTYEELLHVPAFEIRLQVQQMKLAKNQVCL